MSESRTSEHAISASKPSVYTVEEAGKLLRLGRSAAYAAAGRGDLPTIRIGRTLRVPRHRLEEMLGECHLKAAATSAEGSVPDELSETETARAGTRAGGKNYADTSYSVGPPERAPQGMALDDGVQDPRTREQPEPVRGRSRR